MSLKLKNLTKNNGFMKYLQNTSWLFVEKSFRMTIGVFIAILVARYLGPDKFGLFSYAQSFVALVAAISSLGLDSILVRELVKDEMRRDELIGTAFWLKLIGAIGGILILTMAVILTSNDYYTNVMIFIIASATVFQSFNVIDFYFQSRVLSRYVVYVNIASISISSLIKLILIYFKAPLIAFCYVVLFDSFVLATGFIYIYVTHVKTGYMQSLKFCKVTAMSLLRSSWPLILSGIFISVFMKIDQVMIMEMIDSEAVGQYAAAVRLSEVWYFIPVVIASSFFPAIINAKKQSEEIYHKRLQHLFDILVWLAILVALLMTFLSDWVVLLLYGEQYAAAGSVLMIHIWAGVAVGFGLVWSNWIMVENMQKILIICHILAMVLNVLINLYLIPKFGILGAGIATAAASLISQFAALLCYKRNIALKFLFNSIFPVHLLIQHEVKK